MAKKNPDKMVKLATPMGVALLDYHSISDNVEHVAASALRGESVELSIVKKARKDLNESAKVQREEESEQMEDLVEALDKVIDKHDTAKAKLNPARAFSLDAQVKSGRRSKTKRAAGSHARTSAAAKDVAAASKRRRLAQINPLQKVPKGASMARARTIISSNIATEMAAGRPQKQAIAIALSNARKDAPKLMTQMYGRRDNPDVFRVFATNPRPRKQMAGMKYSIFRGDGKLQGKDVIVTGGALYKEGATSGEGSLQIQPIYRTPTGWSATGRKKIHHYTLPSKSVRSMLIGMKRKLRNMGFEGDIRTIGQSNPCVGVHVHSKEDLEKVIKTILEEEKKDRTDNPRKKPGKKAAKKVKKVAKKVARKTKKVAKKTAKSTKAAVREFKKAWKKNPGGTEKFIVGDRVRVTPEGSKWFTDFARVYAPQNFVAQNTAKKLRDRVGKIGNVTHAVDDEVFIEWSDGEGAMVRPFMLKRVALKVVGNPKKNSKKNPQGQEAGERILKQFGTSKRHHSLFSSIDEFQEGSKARRKQLEAEQWERYCKGRKGNPTTLDAAYRINIQRMDDAELRRSRKKWAGWIEKSDDPVVEFGTKGLPVLKRAIVFADKELKDRATRNPSKKKSTKKTARKTKPGWKILTDRCQKLWTNYCEKPTKKNLRAVFNHLEMMKASTKYETSKRVRDERSRCLRAANEEAKRLGMKK